MFLLKNFSKIFKCIFEEAFEKLSSSSGLILELGNLSALEFCPGEG